MKNYIKYILAGVIVLITSCGKDYVDLTNPNQITTGSFWKTAADAEAGTTAIYQALITDGTFMRKYMWTMDGRADDCFNVTPVSYIMSQMTSYSISSSEEELYGPWECHYSGIWRANQLLSNIEGIPMDENQKARLKGEAHFLRGLYYFNLVNLFQNVVIYTTVPVSVNDFQKAQSTPEETMAFAISEFKEAIKGCGSKTEVDPGRATKGAAAAYLAKAYLMNSEFDSAAPVLKDIIDGVYGSYSLVANFSDNFTNVNENNDESIFELQYSYAVGTAQGWGTDPNTTWQKQDGYAKSIAPKPVGWGDVCPSPWIWNEFHIEKATDGSYDARIEASFIFPHYLNDTASVYDPGRTDFDPSYTVFTYPQDGAQGFKSFSWSIIGTNLGLTPAYKVSNRKCLVEDPVLMNDWKSDINRRIVRYADILLLYAECLNETGHTVEAATVIKPIRDRAKLPDRSIEFGGYSQDQMRQQLIHERALELACEWWRYLDILRWGWFKTQAGIDLLRSHDPEFNAYKFPDYEGREYLAIPSAEITRNFLSKQNPAWN